MGESTPRPAGRARLIELGRWGEADELAREATEPPWPRTSYPELEATFLPGLSPGTGAGHPDAQRIALHNLQLANRGEDRELVARRAAWVLSADRRAADVDCAWPAVLALLYTHDLTATDVHCRRLSRHPAWLGSARNTALLALGRARLRGLAGDPRGAADVLESLLHKGSGGRSGTLAVSWLVEARTQLGDFAAAEQLLLDHDLAGTICADLPDREHVLAARGALHLAAGRFEPSLADFTACGRVLRSWNVVNPAVLAWRSAAALAASALGKRDLAVALAEDELMAARRWSSPRAVGLALHALAHARGGPDAVGLLEQSVELLELAHARTELIGAHLDLGAVLARAGSPFPARENVITARKLARQSGNEHWVRRAETAARGLATAAARSPLTRQETKVAELASSGYSNQRIADSLTLTRRTVEFHLSSVYRKLGIPGRRELRAALPQAAS